MSSRSSSLRLSSPSDSSRNSSIQPEDGIARTGSLEPETLRPTQQDYQSYTALVRHIDKGDTLLAKRIIATNDQLRNFSVDPEVLPQYINSSTWPLQSSDLPLSDPSSLEDSILAFASAYIRDNNLVLPRQHQDGSSAGLEDLDEIIPDFLPGMMETVDQLLDNLAIMRPAAVRTKRTTLKPMNWNSVLSAGMIGAASLDHDVLLRANQKVRTLLHVEGEDVLTHRLGVMHPPAPPEEKDLEDEAGPKTRPWDINRPNHLSQQERERRSIKREQRAAKRLEREQAKAIKKSTKRRSRNTANQSPNHDISSL